MKGTFQWVVLVFLISFVQSGTLLKALHSDHQEKTLQKKLSAIITQGQVYPKHFMLISIKTLSGRRIALDFGPSQKVIEIKELLQEKEGIPKEQIRLIYGGKVISDESTIQDCQIQAGSSLIMALHLKGGR